MMIPTAILIAMGTAIGQTLPADPPETPKTDNQQPVVCKVTGNEVNVRSGPSTNYYPVLRLNRGTLVTVDKIEYGWAQIIPPQESFSLIAKDYIDLDGDEQGVVNADHVWVRTGSGMSDQNYAKQLKLNTGQIVRIVGETGEFYKIEPPQGARLWISADHIEQTTMSADAAAMKKPEEEHTLPPAPSNEDITTPGYKDTIEAIEKDLKVEFDKPILKRQLQPLIDRLRPIADQELDEPARRYCSYRIQQLNKSMQHMHAFLELQQLGTQLDRQRKQLENQRQSIKPPVPPLQREFDTRGLLLKSFAYSSASGPARFRLVDPDSEIHRTIAYIEVEPESEMDPQNFVGRFVGVRAKNVRLLEGSIDPIKIYTAAEIVVLESAPELPQDVEGGQAIPNSPASLHNAGE